MIYFSPVNSITIQPAAFLAIKERKIRNIFQWLSEQADDSRFIRMTVETDLEETENFQK